MSINSCSTVHNTSSVGEAPDAGQGSAARNGLLRLTDLPDSIKNTVLEYLSSLADLKKDANQSFMGSTFLS